jgi:hypothetical protein
MNDIVVAFNDIRPAGVLQPSNHFDEVVLGTYKTTAGSVAPGR